MTLLGTVLLLVGALMVFWAYLGKARLAAKQAQGLYAGGPGLILIGIALIAWGG